MGRFILPLGVFVVLVGFLAVGLRLNPREVPSVLIDKPAAAFTVPQLEDPSLTFAPEEMKGKVWLFNVWASWCVSCRQEHPLLVQLARGGEVPIIGLDYKDERAAALAWLRDWGNPYTLSAVDANGRVGMDYGVYGVPETYLIDKEGIIRYKQIGPLTPQVIQEVILPKVRELNG
ncbi:MAG: DsbE family thiol:disulfide interchange protein [Nitrospirae bacterium]|nr:DsbE family thiol:disulfide interchange protein [Nitrospirota bacterium]